MCIFSIYVFLRPCREIPEEFSMRRVFFSFIYFRLARRSSAIQHAHSGVRLTGENDRRCNFSLVTGSPNERSMSTHEKLLSMGNQVVVRFFLLRFILFPQVFFIFYFDYSMFCGVDFIANAHNFWLGDVDRLMDDTRTCEGTWKNLII